MKAFLVNFAAAVVGVAFHWVIQWRDASKKLGPNDPKVKFRDIVWASPPDAAYSICVMLIGLGFAWYGGMLNAVTAFWSGYGGDDVTDKWAKK